MKRALALAVLLLAGCGGGSKAQKLAGIAVDPQVRAPNFALEDQSGRTVTVAAQRGHWLVVTFLYTHCPDVCPLIASSLNTVLRARGPKAKLSVLAVSVDPKGDTPAAVRRYIRERGLLPQFLYLLGAPAQLRATWAHWSVSAVSQSRELVDHVAYTALVDTAGRQRVLYDSQVKARQVLHDLRLLMRPRA